MRAEPRAARSAGRSNRSHLVALGLAVLGLALSAYLTAEHYTSSALLACPESATINCAKVTTSRWSVIAGVPVAVLGLAYFVGMTALTVPPAWKIPALRGLRLAGAAVGVLMVVYLVYIELFRVDAICLWCTGVHACTIALFAVILWAHSATAEPLRQDV
jgi:uncharacterized membrane protein